jgi:hypothetical protein
MMQPKQRIILFLFIVDCASLFNTPVFQGTGLHELRDPSDRSLEKIRFQQFTLLRQKKIQGLSA